MSENTNEKLASEIIGTMHWRDTAEYKYLLPKVTAALAAAYRRGVEDAAKLAENCFESQLPGLPLVGRGIADKIRALTKPNKE